MSSFKTLPRVFLGPLEICGFYGGLTRGMRELGATAHFMDVGENTLGYATGQGRHWVSDLYLRALRSFRASRARRRFDPWRLFATAAYRGVHALLIVWVAACHDVIVLKSGSGFTSTNIDLKLFRLCGRIIVFIYHGSDARPPYINGGYREYSPDWLVERTKLTKGFIDRVAPFATYVIDNPLSGFFHDRQVCIYQAIGNVVDDSKTENVDRARPPRATVRILHAPSLTTVKGTDRIRAAIAALKAKGYAIDYVEVSGVPNRVVMEEIGKSDIVIDELFSDTHGAVLALESCMLGRTTVVGSCGFVELDRLVPPELHLPTWRTHPDAVENAIEALVRDESLRIELDRRAQAFAEQQASPRAVAARFFRLVGGEAPENWFYHPDAVRSVNGFGAPETVIGEMIAGVLDRGGPDALMLQGKPNLTARLVALADAARARLAQADNSANKLASAS